MSKTVICEECGRPKEVPAFEGDGVYSRHWCHKPVSSAELRKSALELVEEAKRTRDIFEVRK